jgi:hypothetical protein
MKLRYYFEQNNVTLIKEKQVDFIVAVTEMYPRTPWKLVADPLGTAQFNLGTTELELCNIQGRGLLPCEFSRIH